mmetsp:Transcript_3591/g.7483  ORF Transcript_3591/g.7483 Transcript_3591/m.7483 type:complete len:92 (-) Transcript_3591:22-297(-)
MGWFTPPKRDVSGRTDVWAGAKADAAAMVAQRPIRVLPTFISRYYSDMKGYTVQGGTNGRRGINSILSDQRMPWGRALLLPQPQAKQKLAF